MTDLLQLKADVIRECRALCGCTIGWALAEAIDLKGPQEGARFLYGAQLFVVPCQAGLDHVVLLREADELAADRHEIVDLEEILREFAKLVEERTTG